MAKKILMIDDDQELCEEVSEILRDEGYEVKTASDGIKGKKLIQNNRCDLVMLDLKMPKLTGFELLEYIKCVKPDLKIIVLTGSPLKNILGQKEQEDKNESQILKLANVVLNKPFDISVVLGKVKELA